MFKYADLSGTAPDSIEKLWERKDLEFIAGSGGDLDGDGLPDIYELYACGTDPTKSDSTKSGLLDGYLDLDSDGWTTLQEFRARTNPRHANAPPKEARLNSPSGKAFYSILGRSELTDLPWIEKISVRQTGDVGFSPLEGETQLQFFKVLRGQHPEMLLPFDISIQYAPPGTEIVRVGGGP
jgi:hypothetical protein